MLFHNQKIVRSGLTSSASAIALAPSSPMELRRKSRLVRTGPDQAQTQVQHHGRCRENSGARRGEGPEWI